MSTSFCRGASCAPIAASLLAIFSLFSGEPRAARADVVGQQAAGSANYPNGGLNFIGDMNVASFAGNDGLYAFAVDPTTDYVLAGSSSNVLPAPLGDGVAGHGQSLLSKVKLNAGGAVPTVVDYTTSYHDGPATFGNIAGAVSMAIDTGSGLNKLSDHYAYVGGSSNLNNGGLSNGGKIMKVQLFPPDASFPNGDPGAAPKVVSVYSVSGSSPGFAAAVDDSYAYFLSGTNITRIDLHLADNSPNKITTITGLPNLVYYKADIVNSGGSDMLYVQALGAGVVEINVAAGNVKNTNGVLTLNNGPTVLPFGPSSPGAFAADATQPYAYIGAGVPNNTTYAHYTATTFQSSLSKVVLSGPNIGAVTAVSPLPVLPTFVPADPVNVPAGQTDRTGLSLAAIDPDSHAIIVGTDNNLPGNVLKFSSGGNSDLAGPIFAGAVQVPYNAAFYQNTDPVLKQDTFPYRVGDINMRDVGIDPKAGYVYFGTDTNIPHLLQVQYSQKGSIKGDKVTLPAAAHLTSVNFYANMPAQPSAASTGDLRLAIYSDSSGLPSALMWQSAEIPTKDVPANGGWLSVTNGLPTISEAGDYWLAWQIDSTLDVPSYSPQGPPTHGFSVPSAYGAFPASIPVAPPPGATASLTLTSDLWSMNVVFNSSLLGDFSGDGHVDAADYVVWRKNMGQPSGTLPNDNTGATIGDDQYKLWRSNIGNPAASSGSGMGANGNAAPEPSSIALLMLALTALAGRNQVR
jgi:hypothetical protein